MKRFIAVLICALMLTSLLPSVAFAEEGDPTQQESQPDGQTLTGGEQQEQIQQPDANLQQEQNQQQEQEQQDASRSITDQTAEPVDNTKQTFTVTVRPNNASWGSASGEGSFEEGSTAQVKAEPKESYRFVKWTVNGKTVSEEAIYSFAVTGTCDLVAIFEPAVTEGSYRITAKPNNASYGSASGGGEIKAGESATVTATAKEGYTFIKWTYRGAEVSTSAAYTFAVEGHRELIAVFEPEVTEEGSYMITAKPNNASYGSVSGGGEVKEGENATVTATAKEGYTFVGWTYQGEIVSTSADYTFTVEGHRELIAIFEPAVTEEGSYMITVKPNNASWGSASGGGEVKEGENATVTATAKEGYTFVGWTYRGEVVSTSATYTFKVEGHRELVAVFEEYIAPTKAKTTTNITASCSKVTRGCAVMFSVSVKDAAGKTVTDGYVQLYVNGAAIGSAVKAGKGITWKLTAAEKTKFVLGSNTIQAVYGGTDALAPSEDAVAVKMVKPSKHYKPCCNIDHHSGKCVNVCPGEDVTFKVSLSCGETCQWYVDKGDGCGYVRIKGAICHSYTVKDVTSRMDGYRYRCVIRNACGIVETPTFTLNIACGTLATPKTGDMGLLSPAAAMGAAAVCLLKRRKEEE